MRGAGFIGVGAAGLLACSLLSCGRDTSTLEPAPLSTDPIVFDDSFPAGVDYQAFLFSKVDALEVDSQDFVEGTASLRVTVPGPSSFAGGAIVDGTVRNLSGYNALTFWAKASINCTLNVAGIANDNTGTSLYQASWDAIPLTTSWARYVIPIPLPARLDREAGLFWFAEGAESSVGHTIWFDDIRYATVSTISNPRPVIPSIRIDSFVGGTVEMGPGVTTFDVDGTDQAIDHFPGYFTFDSSNPDVVRVEEDGDILVVGEGFATIRAKLGEVDAQGGVLVASTAPPPTAAPTPTLPPSGVISLFSNAYTNRLVDTFSADWDQATVTDIRIESSDVKAYTNLVFAGIEFVSEPVNATSMTHLYLDVWGTESTIFRVKLVDFGTDGMFGGGDDSEWELTFNASTIPSYVPDQWSSLDIPLENFSGLLGRSNLAQLILSSDGLGGRSAFVDNIYFHK